MWERGNRIKEGLAPPLDALLLRSPHAETLRSSAEGLRVTVVVRISDSGFRV